jgi:hypothetical protein
MEIDRQTDTGSQRYIKRKTQIGRVLAEEFGRERERIETARE